jgi:heme-degrading monooxygenase HmoA
MLLISTTPEPPYYAVIFTSIRTEGDNGYSLMADKMVELATQQPGFLGIESAREEVGIAVSYWKDLDSIKKWKIKVEHLGAQKLGTDKWYAAYKTRIAKVERDYSI